jgi:hypothetical protein
LRFRSITFPFFHEHDGLAFEDRPDEGELEAEVRDADLQDGDRPDHEPRAGDRVVVLGQPCCTASPTTIRRIRSKGWSDDSSRLPTTTRDQQQEAETGGLSG